MLAILYPGESDVCCNHDIKCGECNLDNSLFKIFLVLIELHGKIYNGLNQISDRDRNHFETLLRPPSSRLILLSIYLENYRCRLCNHVSTILHASPAPGITPPQNRRVSYSEGPLGSFSSVPTKTTLLCGLCCAIGYSYYHDNVKFTLLFVAFLWTNSHKVDRMQYDLVSLTHRRKHCVLADEWILGTTGVRAGG